MLMKDEKDIIKTVLDQISASTALGCVVGITGEWGSGKSYLWREKILPKLDRNKVIQVSMLGIESLQSLKQRTVTACFKKKGEQLTKGEIKKAMVRPGEALLAGLKIALKGID